MDPFLLGRGTHHLSVWEVGEDGLITRHVELAGEALRPTVASALDEWTRELEADRIQAYQNRYGVLAEKPITDWDFPHTDISHDDFERIWADARRALKTGR